MGTIEHRVAKLEKIEAGRDQRIKAWITDAQQANAKLFGAVNSNVDDLRGVMGDMRGKTVASEFNTLKRQLGDIREKMATKRDLVGIRKDMATKSYLESLRTENQREFESIRTDMATKCDLENGLKALREEIDSKHGTVKTQLTELSGLMGRIATKLGVS